MQSHSAESFMCFSGHQGGTFQETLLSHPRDLVCDPSGTYSDLLADADWL